MSRDAAQHGPHPRLPGLLVVLINGRYQQAIGREAQCFIFSSPLLGYCVHPLKIMASSRWPSPHSLLSLSPDYASLLSPFQTECGASKNTLCLLVIALPAPLYSIVIFITLSSKHKICMGHPPPTGMLVDPWGNPGAGRGPGQPSTLPMPTETLGLGRTLKLRL